MADAQFYPCPSNSPQLFSPGSEMDFWHLALGSSPSCRVTWAGKLPMVSTDHPYGKWGPFPFSSSSVSSYPNSCKRRALPFLLHHWCKPLLYLLHRHCEVSSRQFPSGLDLCVYLRLYPQTSPFGYRISSPSPRYLRFIVLL